MAATDYVHGYNEYENQRLHDQAGTLAELLHHDTRYPPGSRVLEAGCGVGGQTVFLAANSPDARFTSIDRSPESVAAARQQAVSRGLTNVEFQAADIFDLPFEDASFDHVFLCFVLEHLPQPEAALVSLQRVVRPGGTITAIEGDHGSTYFHPRSAAAWWTIQCLIDLQEQAGGDSLIGRRLYSLFAKADLCDISTSPRMVYVDASRPRLIDGFTRKTFIAMVEGVRDTAIERGMMGEAEWNRGIADLHRTTEPDGAFCYTFFKAVGIRP